MKRIFSFVLTIAMLLSVLPLTTAVSASADYPDVVVSPAQLNLNMDQNASMTRTIMTYDDLNVIRIVPNSASSEQLMVDGYNIASRNVTMNEYRYAYMDYYYECDEDVSSMFPMLNLLQTMNAKHVESNGSLVANKWARAIFDFNSACEDVGVSASNNIQLKQYHLYMFGEQVRANEVKGTMYISQLVFTDTVPGIPVLYGINISPKTADVYKGYSTTFTPVIDGVNSPVVNLAWSVIGATSSGTSIKDGILTVGKDEAAETLTVRLTNVKDPTMFKDATATVKEREIPQQTFDEDNIVLTFGVTSDTHISGSWNQQRSVNKLSHMVDVFQKQAEAEGVKLDAILVNGDLVDAVANGGSNVQATSSYGVKAAQNYREVSYLRSVWEGKETNHNSTSDKNAGGVGASCDYGPGIYGTDTKLFYALGNHDENGQGIGVYNKQMTKGVRGDSGYVNTVYSAEYYSAIFCGWEYDYQSAKALAADDGYDPDYLDYIDLVYQMYKNKDNASALATAKQNFSAKYNYISPDEALNRFLYYYGDDTEFTRDEYGLFYGNRHTKIGDYHFIAIELSQSANSARFLDKWCAESVKEDPTKPIFILTHYKMVGTIYDSARAGGTGLEATLNKYPQCIIWGGHTHTPLYNENAIMQKGYTAVESSVLAYLSMNSLLREDIKSLIEPNYNNNYYVPDNEKIHENHKQGVCCWVQIDKNNNVRIKRLDVYRSFASDTDTTGVVFNNKDKAVFQKDPWIISGIDSAGDHLYAYTAARGADENNPAPYFPDTAKVTRTPFIKGATTVKFDAAIDDDVVKYYFVEVYDGDTFVTRKALTSFFNECKDQTELLALHPTFECSFSGLDETKDYTVKVTAYDAWNRASETKIAEIDMGDLKVYKIDGVYCAFVDTTGKSTTFTMDGETYNTYKSMETAIDAGAQRIYYIRGTTDLLIFAKYKQPIEVIGIERDNAVFEYAKSLSPTCDFTLRNVTLDKQTTGDTGILLLGHTLTFDSIRTKSNPINFFNTGWAKAEPSGTLIITGDSGEINQFFPGPSYSATATTKGDVTLIIEGGTYKATIGAAKNAAAAAGENMIDGNVFFTISGGTFNGLVTAPTSNAKTNVTKNAVIRIEGGTFNNKIGHTGTSYVGGKEVYIFDKTVYDANKSAYQASNEAILIVCDSAGGIGDATLDANGYITGFAIEQVQNRTSYVNGEPATSFTVEAGQTYNVTYDANNMISFNTNGGTGNAPADITGTLGQVMTLPTADEIEFSREHYTFIGWAQNADATEADVVTTFAIPEKVATLYAVWKADPKFTISFDKNGGKGTLPEEIREFAGVTLSLPGAELEKKGFYFAGWARTADAEEAVYPFVTAAQDEVLYAVWKVREVKVVYADGTYTGGGSNGDFDKPFTTMAQAASALGTNGGIVVVKGTLAPMKGNFGGTTGSEITVTSLDPKTGVDYSKEKGAMIRFIGSVYLTSDVIFENCVIFYSNNSGYGYINAMGHAITIGTNARSVPKGVTPEGCEDVSTQLLRFRGGTDNGSFDTTSLTFYDFEGVQEINAASQSAGKISGDVNLTVEGGAFSGTFNLGNNTNNNATIGGNVNVVVNGYEGEQFVTRAEITAIEGAVQFIFNNGTYDAIETKTLNTTVTPAKGVYIINSKSSSGFVEPTAEAGVFKITTEEEVIYINGVAQTLAADDLYTLSGAQDNVYVIECKTPGKSTLFFNINGGEGETPESIRQSVDTSLASFPTVNFQKKGHTFKGWGTTADATETIDSFVFGEADAILYAVYTRNRYTISFNAGKGRVLEQMDDITADFDTEIQLPSNYTLYGTGLSFAGWSLKEDALPEQAVTSYTVDDKNVTFYAVYTPVDTCGVTPLVSDAELPEGTYLQFTLTNQSNPSIGDVKADLSLVGTVTDGKKINFALINAADGTPAISTQPIPFKVDLGENALYGKEVYPYLYSTISCKLLEAETTDDTYVTFSTAHLGTIEFVLLAPNAKYELVGQYNEAAREYAVSVYLTGDIVKQGGIAFRFDNTVYDYAGYRCDYMLTAGMTGDKIFTTWASDDPIDAVEERALIATYYFHCDPDDYDADLSAQRFIADPAPDANELGNLFDGTRYCYVAAEQDELKRAIVGTVADEEPITESYRISGSMITVRPNGKTPLSNAVIDICRGTYCIKTVEIEDAMTKTGTVDFEIALAPGDYTLALRKNGYLCYETYVTVADADVSIGSIKLVPGDIKASEDDVCGDGIVDLADFVRVLRGLDFSAIRRMVDIDEDGAITVTDLGYIKANYGKRSETAYAE